MHNSLFNGIYKAKRDSITIIFCFFLLLLNGCKSTKIQKAEIIFEKSSSLSAFINTVSSVKLIPIYDDPVLGSRVELFATNDHFLLCDMNNDVISSYDKEGNYERAIGRKGNGPDEYQKITNVQIVNDSTIAVITSFNGILFYNFDGLFLNRINEGNLGLQSALLGKDIITYYGYMPTAKNRVGILREGILVEEYLPTSNPAIPYSTTIPQFCLKNDRAFIIDSYSNILYRYYNGTLEENYIFNFG